MVIFKGTNFYPRQIESLILQSAGLGPEYQVLLERGAGGDRLAVLVESREGGVAGEARRLEQAIRARLNLTAEVRVLKEGELPRSPGKAVRVVDRRHAAS
jgi:phenylacetate-CoA ligase